MQRAAVRTVLGRSEFVVSFGDAPDGGRGLGGYRWRNCGVRRQGKCRREVMVL